MARFKKQTLVSGEADSVSEAMELCMGHTIPVTKDWRGSVIVGYTVTANPKTGKWAVVVHLEETDAPDPLFRTGPG